MFDRKQIDPVFKALVYHGSTGRARYRRVKTGLPNTTPLFFTHYSHASTLFPNLKLLISASALPNPIVATGFYAARQPCQLSQGADLPPPFAEQRCRCGYGPAQRLSCSRPAARKPDSEKVCIARGTSISQFSIADRRVSGRLRTAGSLERHQLGRTGSATLPLENNRKSSSCSRAEGRLKIAASLAALLARKFQRAKGQRAQGL